MGGLCDHCDEAPALLYCRADTARLCLACDRHVHSANAIFSKHARFHLCGVCSAAAATIFCDAHRRPLCPNCDFDAHPPAAAHHLRRPFDAISGCPSALELAAGFGFDEDDKSVWFGGDGDGLVWVTPSIVRMSDLIVPAEPHFELENHDLQILDVPPPPKHRKVASGKHKEEVIRQLRHLLESESIVYSDNTDADLLPKSDSGILRSNSTLKTASLVNVIDYTDSNAPLILEGCTRVKFEAQLRAWPKIFRYDDGVDLKTIQYEPLIGNSVDGSSLVTDVNDSGVNEISQTLVSGEIPQPFLLQNFSAKGLREITAPHRDTLISRYKEKRKTRRYDKQIRYESRKVRADSRVRIKGRFAKVPADHTGDP